MRAQDIMTRPATSAKTLSRVLLDVGTRAMPIVEGSRIPGIVTRGDIVRVFARPRRFPARRWPHTPEGSDDQ